MTILEANPNTVYYIKDIDKDCDKLYYRRLLDLGFTPNSKIFVQGKAPFGGTVLIRLRGALIALRESVAKYIVIDK